MKLLQTILRSQLLEARSSIFGYKLMKTIVLVDGLWEGHHSVHFKVIAKIFLELGHQVLACCPKPDELEKWVFINLATKSNLSGIFEFYEPELKPDPQKIDRLFTCLARWKLAAAAAKAASLKAEKVPDLFFFPWLDSYLNGYVTHHFIDRIFPYTWSGIYHQAHHLRMQPKFPMLRRGPFNPQAILYSSRCSSLGVMDRGIVEQLQNRLNSKPVIPIPDIADRSLPDTNFSIAKQIKQKAKGRKIVGLLGAQGKRKGLITLLEVAQKMNESDYFFVFAGVLTVDGFSSSELEKIENAIQENPENCYFFFEKIPDEPQFNALIDLCDLLFVVYEKYPFISNILTKAAIFEKPVIASETFYIGEMTRKFDLGVVIPEGDVLKCIEVLCDWNQLSGKYLNNNEKGYEEYKYLNSPDQLRLSLQRILSTI